jgi:glycosyltransferase involved in cell wall biosynthesis
MRRAINPFYDMIAYVQLKSILKKIRPDIIHTHSAKAGILGRFAGYALKGKFGDADKPHVIHTIHGLAFHPYLPKRTNDFYIAVERSTAKRTDAFITVADVMTEKALAVGMGTKDMYTTAYSAIEEDDYLAGPDPEKVVDFRRKLGISDQATVLVTIARLAELKGHEYIIESARRLSDTHPDCIWLFVGDGHLSEQIKNDIQMAGLQYKFKFTGLIDPSEIPLAIHSSDILVHCSLREGLARALPQGMLCCKPVISFDIDGAKEVVNENTGRLIEAEDVDGLTAACKELIEDAELRKQLGQNGCESVTKQFAPDTMVDTIEQVYSRQKA